MSSTNINFVFLLFQGPTQDLSTEFIHFYCFLISCNLRVLRSPLYQLLPFFTFPVNWWMVEMWFLPWFFCVCFGFSRICSSACFDVWLFHRNFLWSPTIERDRVQPQNTELLLRWDQTQVDDPADSFLFHSDLGPVFPMLFVSGFFWHVWVCFATFFLSLLFTVALLLISLVTSLHCLSFTVVNLSFVDTFGSSPICTAELENTRVLATDIHLRTSSDWIADILILWHPLVLWSQPV